MFASKKATTVDSEDSSGDAQPLQQQAQLLSGDTLWLLNTAMEVAEDAAAVAALAADRDREGNNVCIFSICYFPQLFAECLRPFFLGNEHR